MSTPRGAAGGAVRGDDALEIVVSLQPAGAAGDRLLVCGVPGRLGRPLARARVQRPIVARILAQQGHIAYDYQTDRRLTDPPGSWLVRRLFGEDIDAAVTFVWLGQSATDDDVARLVPLSEIQGVSLSENAITDACIDDLLKLRKLRGLSLSNTSITPAGLQRLQTRVTLEELSLHGVPGSDAHVAMLPGFPQLRSLQLIRTNVSDEGLRAVSACAGLEQLHLYETPGVTDAGFAAIASLHELKRLHVLHAGITDEAVETIGQLRQLEELHLANPHLTDRGMMHLANHTELVRLFLPGAQFTDEGFAVVKRMTKLQRLEAPLAPITDRSLIIVAALPELERLDVTGTQISDKGLVHLQQTTSLLWIELGLSEQLTLEGVRRLRAALPRCVVECSEESAPGQWIHVREK